MSRFFVVGSLPVIDFGSKPDITVLAFSELVKDNLKGSDQKDFQEFQNWIDLNNLNHLISGKKFDAKGFLSEETMQLFISEGVGFSDYVYEFLDLFTTDQSRKENFPWLIARYFKESKDAVSRDLKPFLQFEHDWRVLVTAYRAKKVKRDIGKELQFEDSNDPIVAMAIAQKDSQGKFTFPYEYRDLERLLEEAGSNPMRQYEVMAKYRFDYYLGFVDDHQFSIVGIIAYMMRLWILEEFFDLRDDKGNKILDNLMESKDAKERQG